MPLLASSTYTTSGLSAETPIILAPVLKLLSTESESKLSENITPEEASSTETSSKVNPRA